MADPGPGRSPCTNEKCRNFKKGGRVGHENENDQLVELGDHIWIRTGQGVFGSVIPLLKFR